MKETETEEDEVKSDAELYAPFIAVLPLNVAKNLLQLRGQVIGTESAKNKTLRK